MNGEARGARLSIAVVLGRSIGIWVRNFGIFTLIALLVQTPLILLTMYLPVRNGPALTFLYLGTTLLPGFFALITAGFLADAVFRQMREEPVELGRSVRVGLSSLLRVSGVALVVGLEIFLLVILAGAGAGMAAVTMNVGFGATSVVMMFLAIPIPMIICRLWVAVPAAVIEQAGVGASLRRSSALTRGARLRVFAVIAVLGLLHFGAGKAVIEVVPEGELRPRPAEEALDRDVEYWRDHTIQDLANTQRSRRVCWLLATAVLGGLAGVMAVVSYYELRRVKETVSIDQVAAVFE